MLNPKTNQRELAYITTVTDAKTLAGYDRVHYVHVLGWWCVASKDIQVGDRVIYFEVDSVLPERDKRFLFMAPRKYRVKTQKMCKVISQGLVLPAKGFPEIAQCREGDFVTDKLGVTLFDSDLGKPVTKGKVDAFTKAMDRHKKFFSFPPVKFFMRYRWFRFLMTKIFVKKKDTYSWPEWLTKTNQERVQNVPVLFEDKKAKWILTEKVDGASTSAWLDEKNVYGVGSHNVVVFHSKNPESKSIGESGSNVQSNVWYEQAEHYNLHDVLKRMKEKYNLKTVAIQGETYGDGIQKRTYGMKCGKHDFAVFHILFNGERVSIPRLVSLCEEFNLPHVHVFDWCYTLPDTVEDLIADVDSNKSVIDHGMIEGFVLYSQDGQTSYKCVSPSFLLKYH